MGISLVMNRKSLILHTPPGSKPFFKNEALFRNQLAKKLSNFFENWGYFPIETPIIDYADAYSSFQTEEQLKQSLRFIDREGELVQLRNDITLFAAKFIASRLQDNKETLRYYYADSIIRYEYRDAPREYFQIGCEIVGNDFTDEQIESMIILIEAANLIGLRDFTLHIGDVSVYEKLFDGMLEEEDYNAVLNLIRLRDRKRLVDLLDNLPLNDIVRRDCLEIAFFIGDYDDFKSLDLSPRATKSVENIIGIAKLLSSSKWAKFVTFDLSEIPEKQYYNGVFFQMYAKGSEKPISTGGRYDRIFKKFGMIRSAVGFSFWLYPLEKIIGKSFDALDDNKEIKISSISDFEKASDKVKVGEKIKLIYD